MAESSPARPRSHIWASPARSVLSDIISDELERNSEARHNAEIQQAQLARNKVREDAERILRAFEQAEQARWIREEKKKEEERIRREEALATERLKLLELKAKKVEIPPLPPPSPELPKAQPAASKPSPPNPPSKTIPGIIANSEVETEKTPTVLPTPLKSPISLQAPTRGSFPGSTLGAPAQPSNLSQPKPQPTPAQAQSQAPVSAAPPKQPAPSPAPDRYLAIHKNLKILRKTMTEQVKSNPALKTRMGDMRREIRKNVGQLTSGLRANTTQQSAISRLLRESLANNVQSQMMDPSNFVLEPREPKEGAAHNGHLPSLFLYMVNTLSKAAISQFINEAGAKPETADPVGVVLASTFSDPEFHWRGLSLIDILLAKFRVVCPVLFGHNGKETTEQGRARLGWWKDGNSWITEQAHMDRMTGLGAGFAAISLRNFKKTPKVNPHPPRNYWLAMARIINTAPAGVSNTQCVVLMAMIKNYEAKFVDAYGSAAVQALRLALVELPKKSLVKGPAVSSLEVHATVLKRDTGLDLFTC